MQEISTKVFTSTQTGNDDQIGTECQKANFFSVLVRKKKSQQLIGDYI